jgi:spore maturation protein CgeB
MHHGKIALCFLRKMNRDQITTRSIEIPAMGRAMVAERTEEHDAHFVDGVEYMGFSTDDEIVAKAGLLLSDSALRSRIAAAGKNRCWASGYTTADRATQMIAKLTRAIDCRATARHGEDIRT